MRGLEERLRAAGEAYYENPSSIKQDSKRLRFHFEVGGPRGQLAATGAEGPSGISAFEALEKSLGLRLS